MRPDGGAGEQHPVSAAPGAQKSRSDGEEPRAEEVGSGSWLREHFPEKDWHEHRRTDGRTDWCDGTPSDCGAKERL